VLDYERQAVLRSGIRRTPRSSLIRRS